jgi:hypothetical protein
MSDERYAGDGSWPMPGSERRDDSARSGLGTMARPGGRPRQDRTADAGTAAQEARRGRQARPAPPPAPAQRKHRVAPQATAESATAQLAGTGQRPGPQRTPGTRTRRGAGAPWRVPPARRTAEPRPAGPRAPQAEPAQPTGTQAQAPPPVAGTGPHRMPFVLLLCGLLGGALISALVISTTLAEGSFKISKLQDSTSALARQRQALADQVAQAQSAQVIEERAAKLGMRRTGELRFVNLTTGKVTDDGPTWAGAVNAPGYAP